MDIAVWLRSLGLGKYEAAFRENEIDKTILPSLTAEDLKDLGVAALGHRRKLLDAIAALRTSASGKAPSDDVATASTAPSAPPEDRAERRQVTVMFSDLVGSTALSTRMDPEDLREVISAYQKCVADTVQRFGGFVAKYMGDGVLIYFGYPQAHEDDAERAVRAGLNLVAAVSALQTQVPLQTRVGIATGLVVVGDLIGSGSSQEQAIVGETPNLAARLQGVAEPNSVVIAESTRRLVGSLFEFEDLGAKELKGIAGPVKAWAVLRSSSVESRFEALHAGDLTELVGREEELEVLLRRWSKAKAGEGQVVLLSGEPGIGKSRLTAALMERLANEPHRRLRYFCSPQHPDSALYPIISQMERAAGFAHDDTPQAKLEKLDALLALSCTARQDATLLAEMLSLPNDGRHPKLELVPQQRRQRTFEALISRLEALSRSNPVLMIFEDVHWVDPTSIELLDRTVDRLRTLGILLIITYRPEFEPTWIGRPYVTALSLNRFGEREIAAMIDGITDNKQLPVAIKRNIVERTDGIPLFVEEITKAVLEAEGEQAADHVLATAPPSSVPVPASLHASLMARLDRLGSAKEITQIGATIGREFSYALLATVAQKPEGEVRSALDRLITAGLLFRQGVPPNATYLFKHALVQDAAYGTLLREPRRSLHARVAQAIEDQFVEIVESRPEVLARHFSEAGLIEKAATLWAKAGQRSLERSALVEAIEQLTRGLDQYGLLPKTPARRGEQIKLQVYLITPLIHVKGHAAPETKAAVEKAKLLIEEAETLGEHVEDPLLLFTVLYGNAIANYFRANGDALLALASQFLALAEKQAEAVPVMIGHRVMGHALFLIGRFAKSRAHYEEVLKLYDPARHGVAAARVGGQDTRMSVLSHRARALWLLGYSGASRADVGRAIRHAREIEHAATLMSALNQASFVHVHCGEYDLADALLTELAQLVDEKGAAYWKALGLMTQGALTLLRDNASGALGLLTIGLNEYQSTGATVFVPWYLTFLATAYGNLGQYDDALRVINEAAEAVDRTNERWCEAEVLRVAGAVTLLGSERDNTSAQKHFERALAVARQQQAKSWELRAAMSLARLWRDQGKVSEARELLAPVYGWFTEGFDTRDLKEAKALLEQLAA
jgi:class 3 adenylate cyclase/predicted ATPase